MIVVSHDREFLDGLVEKVYEFGGGKVRECLGGIYEFLEKKKLASLRELERATGTEPQKQALKQAPAAEAKAEPGKTSSAPQKESAPSAPKLTYAEQRERDKMLRKAAKKVEEAETAITRIEGEIAAIEARLASGDTGSGADVASGESIFDQHARLQRNLENAMSVWELASSEHEELAARFAR